MEERIADALKPIRDVVWLVESELRDSDEETRRAAQLQLAWHHLMDAYNLLNSGRLTPEDVVWGAKEARRILMVPHGDERRE